MAAEVGDEDCHNHPWCWWSPYPCSYDSSLVLSQMPCGSHCGWTEYGIWEVPSHRKHRALLVASCCAHASLAQNHLSFPAISSLSLPTWVSLCSSQLCLCTCSKYLPRGAQILLPSVPAHSWGDCTQESLSTIFLWKPPVWSMCSFFYFNICY